MPGSFFVPKIAAESPKGGIKDIWKNGIKDFSFRLLKDILDLSEQYKLINLCKLYETFIHAKSNKLKIKEKFYFFSKIN